MRVLTIYNRYRTRVHGEEVVVAQTVGLLRERGVEVDLFTRDSADISDDFLGHAMAALEAVYSRRARRMVHQRIDAARPDVLHAHNVYPLLTPSALLAASERGVPVVLTLHHYMLTCPVLTHYRHSKICTRCLTGQYRHAVHANCRGNRLETLAYALRSSVARQLGWFHRSVSAFVALTEFAKDMLIASGYPSSRIHVLPNAVPLPPIDRQPVLGGYMAFVGRLTEEKGIDDFVEAARRSRIPARVAGDVSKRPDLVRTAPGNVEFAGVLSGTSLDHFYRGARFIVVPSRWFEMCPMVVLEAMSYGRPVIASRVGGLAELVIDNETGRLVTPSDPDSLAMITRWLWDRPEQCIRLGSLARERVRSHHGEPAYVERLMAIYRGLCGDHASMQAGSANH